MTSTIRKIRNYFTAPKGSISCRPSKNFRNFTEIARSSAREIRDALNSISSDKSWNGFGISAGMVKAWYVTNFLENLQDRTSRGELPRHYIILFGGLREALSRYEEGEAA